MAYTSSQVVQAVPTGINSALVLISVTNVTGSSVTILNCFSSTYQNYLIVADSIVGSTSGYAIEQRFGVSNTPTTTGYIVSSGTGAPAASAGYINYNSGGTDPTSFTMNVFQPNAAQKTTFTQYGVSTYNNYGTLNSGVQTSSNQFTDFSITKQAGAADYTGGTIRIYGYLNS